MNTLPHTSWPPRPPVEDIGPNGAPVVFRCYLPKEGRRARAPLTMPVLVLAVLAVAALLLFLFYRISI